MADGIDLGLLFDKPPREVMAYFEQKGFRLDHWNWWDTWQDANARAFVIAKVARLDVQQSIRNRLREALANGISERAFIKQMEPELRRLGWWGKEIAVAPDGGAEIVRKGSPWRLKTIYRTNMGTAYNAGRWKQQMENKDSRPYLMYVAVMDSRTRASHAAMNGRVFRVDDPIWNTHYPPCAFNCRCRVRALTEAQVKRRGIKVESSEGRLTEVMQEVGVDKRTGEVIIRPGTRFTAPNGDTMTPAPGWSYNPGRAAWQPDLDGYDVDLARQYVEGMLTGPAFEQAWRKWDARVDELFATPGMKKQDVLEALKAEVNPQQWWPVAVVDAADQNLLGVGTQVVRLSDWTLAKQVVSRRGQDFGVRDYWRVQPTIESARWVFQDHKPTGTEVYLYYGIPDQLYLAVLKPVHGAPGRPDELYLESFRRTNERELARAQKKFDALR